MLEPTKLANCLLSALDSLSFKKTAAVAQNSPAARSLQQQFVDHNLQFGACALNAKTWIQSAYALSLRLSLLSTSPWLLNVNNASR